MVRRKINQEVKNPKQEFIDKYPYLKLERNKEYKIQLKMRCLLNDSVTPRWKFAVGHMFHKDEIIGEKGFWRRESISITNSQRFLLGFRRFDLIDELEKLKELCKELKQEI